MTVVLPVLSGVSVLRVVTATHRSTAKTGAEVNPGVTHVDALVADRRSRLRNRGEIAEVIASLCHNTPV